MRQEYYTFLIVIDISIITLVSFYQLSHLSVLSHSLSIFLDSSRTIPAFDAYLNTFFKLALSFI